MNEWITKKNSFNFIYLFFKENGVNFHGAAFAHHSKSSNESRAQFGVVFLLNQWKQIFGCGDSCTRNGNRARSIGISLNETNIICS